MPSVDPLRNLPADIYRGFLLSRHFPAATRQCSSRKPWEALIIVPNEAHFARPVEKHVTGNRGVVGGVGWQKELSVRLLAFILEIVARSGLHNRPICNRNNCRRSLSNELSAHEDTGLPGKSQRFSCRKKRYKMVENQFGYHCQIADTRLN